MTALAVFRPTSAVCLSFVNWNVF